MVCANPKKEAYEALECDCRTCDKLLRSVVYKISKENKKK